MQNSIRMIYYCKNYNQIVRLQIILINHLYLRKIIITGHHLLSKIKNNNNKNEVRLTKFKISQRLLVKFNHILLKHVY